MRRKLKRLRDERVQVNLTSNKLEKLEVYMDDKDCYLSDCIRAGIEIQKREGVIIKPSEDVGVRIGKQLRVTKEEHEEIRVDASRMGINISDYLEGSLDSVLNSK